MPDLATVLSILQFSWPILAGFIGSFAYLKFFRKKEGRLFKNIQRRVGVIGTDGQRMEHEAQLLKRVGLFNVELLALDGRALDLIDDHRLIVLGYTPESGNFKNIFNAIKNRKIPVIIYSGPARITTDDLQLIQSYSHHTICNTPLRMVSDVFAIMGTYPENL